MVQPDGEGHLEIGWVARCDGCGAVLGRGSADEEPPVWRWLTFDLIDRRLDFCTHEESATPCARAVFKVVKKWIKP